MANAYINPYRSALLKPKKVTYGAKGLKRGVAKAQQRRNLPGGSGPILTQPPGGWQYNQGQGTTTNPYDTGWNQGQGGGGGHNTEPGNGPRPIAGQEPTAAFLAKLKAAGLKINNQGKIVGGGMGNAQQLKLAQRGYNKFGLTNTYFDPTRAAYANQGLYSLGTGSGLRTANGSGDVLRDQRLAALRDRSGWNVETDLANSGYGPNSGIAFQSPEMYQRYLDAGRANYQMGAGGQVTNPNAQALLDAGTIRTDVPNAVPAYQSGAKPAAGSVPPPMTDQVTNPNVGGTAPGQSPPIITQPQGGWQPTPQPQAQGLDQLLANKPQFNTQGLPLDPTFEAQRRIAEDQLARTLAQIAPQRENIAAQQALAQARLGTQQGYDTQQLLENAASRGTLDSGLYGESRGRLATDYLRQNQDLSADVADAYSALSEAASGAYGDYAQQMAEYLLELANRTAADQNSPVNRVARRNPKKRNKRNKRAA